MLQQTELSSAMENGRLYYEAENGRHNLEAIWKVVAAINSETDLDNILHLICEAAQQLFQADHSGLVLFAPDLATGQVRAEYPELGTIGTTVPLNDIPAEQKLLRNQKPLLLHDVEIAASSLGKVFDIFQNFHIKAILIVPIIVKGQVIGSFSLDSLTHKREFTAEEIELCQMFAAHVAIAIENARLFAEANHRARQLELLSKATNEIMDQLGTLHLDDILQLIVQHAAEILDVEGCGISLVQRPDYLTLKADYGYQRRASDKAREFAIQSGQGTGLTGHIAFEGQLFNSSGKALREHPAVSDAVPPSLPSGECYSLLVMPLWSSRGPNRRLLGLLRAENKKDKDRQPGPHVEFTAIDEWLIQLMADVVVVAIQSYDLFDQLSSEQELSTRLIASSPDAVVAIDNHGRITTYNAQAQTILEYPPEVILGQRVDRLYADRDEPVRIGKLIDKSPDDKLVKHYTSVRSQSGNIIPIRLTTAWLKDKAGNRTGSVGYFEDLREIREMERRLELLLQASNTITQTSDLDLALDQLARMLVRQLDVGLCRIFLLPEDSPLLMLKAARNRSKGKSRRQRIRAPQFSENIDLEQWPILANFLAKSGPQLFGPFTPEAGAHLDEWRRCLQLDINIHSLFLIPLHVSERTVGLLCLGDVLPLNEMPFNHEQTNLATAIAEQTAALIDQIHLLELTEYHRQLLMTLDEASRSIRGEKEMDKLLREVVRVAVQLVDFNVGGLYKHDLHQGTLELRVVYGLPDWLEGLRQTVTTGVVGEVVQTGRPAEARHYTPWSDTFEEIDLFDTFYAVPLRLAGAVEAVLFVASAHQAGRDPLRNAQRDLLERFAAQASLALRTSGLLNQEQRIYRLMSILGPIGDYIQAANDLEKILHAFLTGVTAGYSLGFNRAALLLLDGQRENLIGRMGIGDLEETAARAAWQNSHRDGHFNLYRYFELLEKGELEPTPLDQRIRGLRLPVWPEAGDMLNHILEEKAAVTLSDAALQRLPEAFESAFEPAQPLLAVPLAVSGQTIGLLIADNKFTQTAITDEDITTLFTFVNTAAIAIYNAQLREESIQAQERLRRLFRAGNALVSPRPPDEVLNEMVAQARASTNASFVRLLLLEEGDTQLLVIDGERGDRLFDAKGAMRANGISMEVMRTGKPFPIPNTEQAREHVNPAVFDQGIGAALCLPFSLYGRQLGVMWVYYDEPRPIGDSEIEALQFYVNQAAIAYDNSQRFQKLERMDEAARAMAGETDLAGVLNQIVASACDVLHADSAAIWSYDSARDQFIPLQSVAVGIDDQVWEAYRREEPHKGQTTLSVLHKGWIGFNDVESYVQYPFLGPTRDRLMRQGVKSFQGIALKVGEEKLGVLFVNYNHPLTFTEEHEKEAQTFANHAAQALKNARLLDQLQKARTAAREVAKVTTQADLDVTLQSVVDGTRNALGCDAVTLYAYDVAKGELRHPPAMDGVYHPARAKAIGAVAQDSLVVKLLRQNKPITIEKLREDPLFADSRFTWEEDIHSLAAWPLKVNSETVGLMFINYRSQHRFTSDERKLIAHFADQAAVAIHNAQLYEQLQTRAKSLKAFAKSLEVLYDVGQQVTSSLELDNILEVIVTQTARMTGIKGQGAGYCSVILTDVSGHTPAAAVFPRERLKDYLAFWQSREWHYPDRCGISGWVMEHGESYLTSDTGNDPHYLPFEPLTRSELTVPIKLDGKTIGVINAEHPERNAFGEQDKRAIESLAALVVNSVRNAQAHYEATVLKEVSAALAGALELEQVLSLVLNAACKLTNVPTGKLLFWDEEQQCFEPAYKTDGSGQGIIRYQTSARPNGLTRQIIDSREAVMVFDTWNSSHVSEIVLEQRRHAFIATPLENDSKAVGVLSVHSSEPRQFSEHQLTLLKTLTHQTAAAVNRAKQHEELKHTKGLVGARAAVAWMGMASSIWRHGVEGDALAVRTQIGNLRHHLPESAYTEEVAQILDSIEENVQDILKRPITPPLSEEEGLQLITLNGFLQERIKQLWENGRNAQIQYQTRLQPTEGLVIRANELWLRQIIDILVMNAIEAMNMAMATDMAGGEPMVLTISTQRKEKEVTIEFIDTGCGIAEEKVPYLFQNRVPSSKGQGMGLLIADTIAQTYGGKLELVDSAPRQTTFRLRFPLESAPSD